jgi:imidazoleglycerol-phosphate dehydratase
MDEALVLCALDISGGRTWNTTLAPPSQKIGTFDTELGREFFLAVARELRMTLHLKQFSGLNSHHFLEAAFKGLAARCAGPWPSIRTPAAAWRPRKACWYDCDHRLRRGKPLLPQPLAVLHRP